MQKSHLFDLILAVKGILSDELPVIVGSQATHALSAEKDQEFLDAALGSDLIHIDELLRRLDLAATKVENDVISDRLGRLVDFLARTRIHGDAIEAIRNSMHR